MSKELEKKCCRCKEIKNRSEFHKRSSSKDGLLNHCKDCQKKIKAAYYKKHIKNKPKVYIDYDKLSISEKKCAKCNKTKDVRKFSRDGYVTKDNHGLRIYCKKCDLEKRKKLEKKSKKFVYYIESGEIVTEKKCNTCKESKPFHNFHRNWTGKYNKAGSCKSCRSIKANDDYAKNTAKYRKRLNNYRNRNKDKILNADNYIIRRLTRRSPDLNKSDIPSELIELKRKALQLKREILKKRK